MWRQIFSKRKLLCLLTGFSSGLPLYVLIQLLPAWFRDLGLDLKSIALFSFTTLPYTWKFIWAPLLDRSLSKKLGRRRSWALISQMLLGVLLLSLAPLNPIDHLALIAGIAFCICLASATQDIALDAYRREILSDEELGFGNSLFVNAYRLSSLVPGSLALILADHFPWSVSLAATAVFMFVGILTTLWMPEPQAQQQKTFSLRALIFDPFLDMWRTNGTKGLILLLSFMLLYKLGDNMATALSTPFYMDLGFSKSDIGTIVKAAALWSSITGGVLGGIIMIKIGINKSLWIFGAAQVVTILGFAALSEIGADPTWLFAVVSAEYFGVGLGTAAFVAFVARSTSKAYTAAQLALLTSFAGLPRSIASAGTGTLIEALGYTQFFLLCTALALPGMLLLIWVAPWNAVELASSSTKPKTSQNR